MLHLSTALLAQFCNQFKANIQGQCQSKSAQSSLFPLLLPQFCNCLAAAGALSDSSIALECKLNRSWVASKLCFIYELSSMILYFPAHFCPWNIKFTWLVFVTQDLYGEGENFFHIVLKAPFWFSIDQCQCKSTKNVKHSGELHLPRSMSE